MNVLLTSCGRRSYMVEYFKDVLHPQGGHVYASNSVYTYALSRADKYFITSGIYEEGYIDELLSICVAYDVNVLVSLFDIDLPVLSRNSWRFLQDGVQVVVSNPEVVGICNDKWKTAQYLGKIGIHHPRTFVSLQDAREQLSFPVVVKPRWGMGSIGIQIAESPEELEVLYKKVKRDLFRSYLKFESACDREHSVLIQECIQGDEYGLDVVNNLEGDFVNCIVKRKVAMRAGETDEAVIVEHNGLKEIGQKLGRELRHVANLDVDCFVAGERCYVLELNCRFGGQYPFSHMAGANLPAQIIRWAGGGDTIPGWCTASVGVRSCKDLCPTIMVLPD